MTQICLLEYNGCPCVLKNPPPHRCIKYQNVITSLQGSRVCWSDHVLDDFTSSVGLSLSLSLSALSSLSM